MPQRPALSLTSSLVSCSLSVLVKKAPFTVPAFVLRLAFGEMADLLLFGQNVQPKRLLDNGFEFHYPQLKEALNALQF